MHPSPSMSAVTSRQSNHFVSNNPEGSKFKNTLSNTLPAFGNLSRLSFVSSSTNINKAVSHSNLTLTLSLGVLFD